MKPNEQDSLEILDALLYGGKPSLSDIKLIQEYVDRWSNKLADLRKDAEQREMSKDD